MQTSSNFTCERLSGTLSVAACLSRIESFDVMLCTPACPQAQAHGIDLPAVEAKPAKKTILVLKDKQRQRNYIKIKKLKPQKGCNAANCENEHYALGYCQRHYKNFIVTPKKRGISTMTEKDKKEETGNGRVTLYVETCSIEGCTSPLKHHGLKLCNRHYMKHLKAIGKLKSKEGEGSTIKQDINSNPLSIVGSSGRTALLAQLLYISGLIDEQISLVFADKGLDYSRILLIRGRISNLMSNAIEVSSLEA